MIVSEEGRRFHELVISDLDPLQSGHAPSLCLRVQVVLDEAQPALLVLGELYGAHGRFGEVVVVLVPRIFVLRGLLCANYVL